MDEIAARSVVNGTRPGEYVVVRPDGRVRGGISVDFPTCKRDDLAIRRNAVATEEWTIYLKTEPCDPGEIDWIVTADGIPTRKVINLLMICGVRDEQERS